MKPIVIFIWCLGQLARKYAPELFPHGVVVPVVRSVLADFDVVYAPLITSYGSCSGAPARAAQIYTHDVCSGPAGRVGALLAYC